MCESRPSIVSSNVIAPPLEAPQPGQRPSSRRRKLWELAHKFHCPVIGTCLHVDELREIARKSGVRQHARASDFDIHVRCVAAAEQRGPLSQATHKALERKHARMIKRFARAKDSEQVAALWDQARAEGEIPGAFWALMTHPHADAMLCVRAYEDVHMLSHQIGAGLGADLRALRETRAQLDRAQRNAAERERRLNRSLAEREARIEQLEQTVEQHQGLERALERAEGELAALRDQDRSASLDEERRRADQASARVATLEAQLKREREHRAELAERLAQREDALRRLEQRFAQIEPEDCCGGCAAADDSVPDLAGRRILCVGGRGSLASRYRNLVTRCNGELLRHDGGLEDNRQRLESLLAKADAVICPADNCSHDAYLRTKRFCKRTAKPCVLLERSSVDAFARAIADLVEPPPAATCSAA
ncbi:DUF2325 domain-containing protein [Marichromatium gracile]|uniref:DUF2325 domain-containing protein n=1 Tax=Marichromatium gracile TaxID=1048 RepID=UPI0009EF30C8|nr:DUF2325 domain-containing protein [Marichromatium gracile]